jgi:hypothetical protein
MIKKIKKTSINSLSSFFITLLLIIFVFTSITSCSVPNFAKPKKISKNTPVNAKDRARKNIEEGRGVSLRGMVGGSKSTNYEFSTSNPLWRASLATIDFMPLSTVDYSGGIIITDWYSDSQNQSESIKITVRFLSNEVRSDSIKIIIHNKKCETNQNCEVNEIDSNIKFELTKSILAKAALLEKNNKTTK